MCFDREITLLKLKGQLVSYSFYDIQESSFIGLIILLRRIIWIFIFLGFIIQLFVSMCHFLLKRELRKLYCCFETVSTLTKCFVFEF